MNQIYLDNAATTPIDPVVMAAMDEIQSEYYGNPSSIHSIGQKSKVKLERARTTIAAYIGASPQEIIFTSGGTESDNLAIIGVAMANKEQGRKIISTRIEHPAVLESLNYLAGMGFNIEFLDVDKNGALDLGQFKKMIDGQTILVSIMMANNETGHLLDIIPFAELAKEKKVLFHTDAIQALGKVSININDPAVDLLSLSSHKIYGPKGVGALYIKRGTLINKQIVGGAQEANRRAGTENLAGIAGFASAIDQLQVKKEEINKIRCFRDLFETLLTEQIPSVKINGHRQSRLCSHSNVYFPLISGDSMLMNLDMNGISVSTGSACSSGSVQPSHVLTALGYGDERVKNSIRFSFGRFNTEEQVYHTVKTVGRIYNNLERR